MFLFLIPYIEVYNHYIYSQYKCNRSIQNNLHGVHANYILCLVNIEVQNSNVYIDLSLVLKNK